jgi:hypothetical protein
VVGGDAWTGWGGGGEKPYIHFLPQGGKDEDLGEYRKGGQLYNDNPVVFGVPSPTVRIKGTAFKVEELLGYEGYQIELDLSTGEIGEG